MLKHILMNVCLLALCATALLACGRGSDAVGVSASDLNAAVAQQGDRGAPVVGKDQLNQVGDVVKAGRWSLIVNSARIADDLVKYNAAPPPGHTFLVINVSIDNTTDQMYSFFSDLQFSLQDSKGRKCHSTYLASVEPLPSGNIDAGAEMIGELTYVVPKDQKEFTLVFQDEASNKLIEWDITTS
ncbi:MAG TPA: DUF4352 domain-containing protein [Ktedonosporobacter sp.]|nr:DUF4352 domain-containing protein [Ktedonosporobacter sp.]